MRVAIVGGLGGGKTLLLTIFSKIANDGGLKVYSNYKTTFGELISPLDLIERNEQLHNCFLALDEFWLWMDSRTSGTASNRLLSYFMLQTRKVGVHFGYTSQINTAVDLRARYITDFIILCKSYKKGFSYTPFINNVPKPSFLLTSDIAEEFYPLYDTNEVIYPMNMNPNIIKYDDILETFKHSPTKNSFVVLIRKDLPFMTLDTAKAIYDLLKDDNESTVKKLLNI